MVQNKILLTIGIPVYNGESFIEDTINSIKIPKELQDKVDIVVSDNCSTDKTAEIVNKYSFIKYFKNDINIGYDRNIQNVFLKASGEFVWTIAADDVIIVDDAIEKIINYIEAYQKLSLIHVGGNQKIIGDHSYCKGEVFFSDSKLQSGFVSTNIIRCKTWLSSDPTAFFDTGWIHFGVIMNIANTAESLVTKEKLVDENLRSKTLDKTWDSKGSSLVIMLNLIKIFMNMGKLKYSKEVQYSAKMLIKNNYPKEIIKAKAKGLKVSKNLIFDFITCYKFFPSFWIIDLPFLLSPPFLCRYIYKKRNVLKKGNEI